MEILILFLGLAMLLLGANYLVEASVVIAQKAKLSDFVIGLTIVGIGTSSPELLISVSSALEGHGDISLGNVIGSCICNILLILGLTAVIKPFKIERNTIKRDIPFNIFSSIFLITLLCVDMLIFNTNSYALSRIDGAIFLIVFAGYITYTIRANKAQEEYEESATSSLSGKPLWMTISIAAVSLGVLLWGGNLFLDSSVILAKNWGMSEAVISLTIVAIGTSLPELVTSIIAALKGNPQLALGNVIGSNIFNVLLILGISSLISPFEIIGFSTTDFILFVFSTILVYISAFTLGKMKVDRTEGLIFVAIYIAYTTHLLLK
ncbi:MAG: calcium/sodium antiporter [Bacteroidales bacterium]|nr:calcium/sodium antiporter [Bacteroidales bacterium]